MTELRVRCEIEITVEAAGFESTIDEQDAAQAVQDEIGHTGAVVTDVISFDVVPFE